MKIARYPFLLFSVFHANITQWGRSKIYSSIMSLSSAYVTISRDLIIIFVLLASLISFLPNSTIQPVTFYILNAIKYLTFLWRTTYEYEFGTHVTIIKENYNGIM